MAGTTYVIDNSKCLRTLTNALKNEDVAPESHASETNEYGAASVTEYGHVQLTNESSFVGSAWSDPSTYSGRAISGDDGADFDQRIKDNAQSIVALQNAYKVPIGTIMISDTHATAAAWATAIGYGTWELAGDGTIELNGSTRRIFYFRRTD